MDELRALSTFVRVAELGSFNKAAQAQATTPQAVSKTIRQLEQHLGVRLFHRTTRKSSLTEEGERLLHAARPNLDGLVDALTRARSAVRSDEGLVRISAAGAVARLVLVPMLAAFQAEHPAIQIDLLLEDRFTDLVGERIDVGFRAGNPPEAQVIARRLFTIQQIACASPAYFERHPAPERLQDLLQHRCTRTASPAPAGRCRGSSRSTAARSSSTCRWCCAAASPRPTASRCSPASASARSTASMPRLRCAMAGWCRC